MPQNQKVYNLHLTRTYYLHLTKLTSGDDKEKVWKSKTKLVYGCLSYLVTSFHSKMSACLMNEQIQIQMGGNISFFVVLHYCHYSPSSR